MFTGTVPYTDESEFEWRHHNIGRLLLNAYSYFEQGLLLRFHALGYEEIRPIHLSVLRQMDMAGTRMTTIAARAGVSKQAMSLFVRECEDLGFVKRAPDPNDGRAKIIQFAERGEQFMKDTHMVIEELEREISKALGSKNLEQLRENLKLLGERLVQEDILLNTDAK